MPESLLRGLVCAALLWALPVTAAATMEIAFAVQDMEVGGWRASGITVNLKSDAVGAFSVTVDVAHLVLPAGQGEVSGLRLACDALIRKEAVWVCAEGKLRARNSFLGPQEGRWTGSLKSIADWRIDIPRLALEKGWFALHATARDGRWNARLKAQELPIGRLADLGRVTVMLPDWRVGGTLSGHVRAGGTSAGPEEWVAELVVDRLNYASSDGRQAAEKLAMRGGLAARLQGTSWSFDGDLSWTRGALYTEPLFVDAAKTPLQAKLKGTWSGGGGVLTLDSLSLDLAQTVSLSGMGRLRGADLAIEDLTIAARSDDAGRLYQVVLQPYLIGSAADDLEASGHVGGVLRFDAAGVERAGLELSGLVLADRQGRFAVRRIDGNVAWGRTVETPRSSISVEGASVYRIPTTGFSINAHFVGDRVSLVAPIVVPVLGGQVALDRFELGGALVAGERPHWEASASVRDVSLQQLTTALGWPPFGGNLAAELRDMRYADQVFSVGGGLHCKAFGGDVLVRNLRVQDPLGVVPLLQGEAEIRGLSLDALTQTFSFGRIEGRLDGDVRDLHLVAWRPDRFDLHLYTPVGDDSRRRISQRAVQSLTELGSGVPAGVSGAVLRIFQEFPYDRIDVKVRLQGQAAELDGLARADGGYYLVQGAGLPRIDVIGRNRRVAWNELLNRLRRIQNKRPPAK